MKVYELINQLMSVDMEKEVYFYNAHNEISEIDYVDELSDRVDLNIKEIIHE